MSHFLLREIREQPQTLRSLLNNRVGGLHVRGEMVQHLREMMVHGVTLLGCGSSFHAASICAPIIERLAGLPCSAEHSGDFAARGPIIDRRRVYIGVSHGSSDRLTADALELVKQGGAEAFSVATVADPSAQEQAGPADVLIDCGVDRAVVAMKAFTTQVATLQLIAAALTPRQISGDLNCLLRGLRELPDLVEQALAGLEPHPDSLERACNLIVDAPYVVFAGLGPSAAVAAEGALKLSQLAHLPCGAMRVSELSDSPQDVLGVHTAVVVVVPEDRNRHAVLVHMRELRARGATIIAVHTQGDFVVQALADVSLTVPRCPEFVAPVLAALPLQFLAYHCALLCAQPVDKRAYVSPALVA